jgi:hypothetical protein
MFVLPVWMAWAVGVAVVMRFVEALLSFFSSESRLADAREGRDDANEVLNNVLVRFGEERRDWREHVERLERLVEAKSLSEAAAAERAYTGAPSPEPGVRRKRELTATEEMLGLGDNRRKEKANGEPVP